MASFCRNERGPVLIPVALKPEPANFATNVRVPGLVYLARVPRPTAKQFKKHAYWKFALADLKTAYSSICAYTSFRIPGSGSVDHFRPKSSHPTLAYEWTNFRLAHDKINAYKGDSTDILDPFYIQSGWFILDFASLWVRPDESLQLHIKTSVQKTIDVLRLNDDEWVTLRFDIYKSYLEADVKLSYLQKKLSIHRCRGAKAKYPAESFTLMYPTTPRTSYLIPPHDGNGKTLIGRSCILPLILTSKIQHSTPEYFS